MIIKSLYKKYKATKEDRSKDFSSTEISENDLEAVVGGLSNEELIRSQVRKISEIMAEKNSQNDE